jgi:hypothetical protein
MSAATPPDAIREPGRHIMAMQEHSAGGTQDVEPPESVELPGSAVLVAEEEPLCNEEEFAEEVRELVAAEAPRVFALVEEYGERVDGWIVGWGIVFEDHVEILGATGRLRASVASVERARWVFSRRRKIRLVWTSAMSPLAEQAG